MINRITVMDLRRGDDLALRVEFTNNGNQYAMTDWEVEASLFFNGCNKADLVFEWIDQNIGVGRVTMSEEDTQDLLVDDYELRIRATSPDGYTVSSPPVTIRVSE